MALTAPPRARRLGAGVGEAALEGAGHPDLPPVVGGPEGGRAVTGRLRLILDVLRVLSLPPSYHHVPRPHERLVAVHACRSTPAPCVVRVYLVRR